MAQGNSNNDYDLFEELESKDTFARSQPVQFLKPGQLHKVLKVSQQVSQFKDKKDGTYPLNLLVEYNIGNMRFVSILPKKFNNKSQRFVDTMNKLISNKMGPNLIYYGSMGMNHEVDLLRHTEAPNAEKMQIVKEIVTISASKEGTPTSSPSQSPMKRNLPFEGSPSKYPKQD